MEKEIFKKEAIRKSLLLINEPPENWKTFNNELHTKIIEDVSQTAFNHYLKEDELPVLECVLQNNFVLITTDRIVSSFGNNNEEMFLQDVVKLGNEFDNENFKIVDGRLPKTNIISVIGKGDKELLFEIDSYYPAHFVRTLIINMSYFLKNGKWFWKPNS